MWGFRLAFSGDKRGRSRALFFAVLNGTHNSDPEPVRFSCDPENWAYGRIPSESTAKATISARMSFPTRAGTVPLLDWLLTCVAHDFCNPQDPDALGDDSFFFAVTQPTTVACLHSQNVTLQTGLQIATLLFGSLMTDLLETGAP